MRNVSVNQVWLQHKTGLRGFLLHRAANPGDADDVLQEVFLKALSQGNAFDQLENPRAWLFHVARNLLVDRLRLRKDQVPLPDDLCAEPELEVQAVDRLSQCIPRVLSELSTQDREAILFCDLRGMSQKDYAEYLGLTLPAAKSRVQRARQRMQAQMVKACQVRFDETGKICCFVPRPALSAEVESTAGIATSPAAIPEEPHE